MDGGAQNAQGRAPERQDKVLMLIETGPRLSWLQCARNIDEHALQACVSIGADWDDPEKIATAIKTVDAIGRTELSSPKRRRLGYAQCPARTAMPSRSKAFPTSSVRQPSGTKETTPARSRGAPTRRKSGNRPQARRRFCDQVMFESRAQ
jgi:hypothetical protein